MCVSMAEGCFLPIVVLLVQCFQGSCRAGAVSAPGSEPRDVTPEPLANNSRAVSIHWKPPERPNGQITGYLIFYTTDGSQEGVDWVIKGVVSDKMSAVISRLTLDTTYYFKVRAITDSGFGPFSRTVQYHTPAAECPRYLYGQDCGQHCGHCKNDDVCNVVTGNCPDGCDDGYDGLRCDTCERNLYGPGCTAVCGQCQNDDVCDALTGVCPGGCREGFHGPRCDRESLCLPVSLLECGWGWRRGMEEMTSLSVREDCDVRRGDVTQRQLRL
ncbi:uncharacterized protein LOC143285262 [Babylonia areolata]|uniref:uncharacterized protein LOC143285262 n=1 Tax=Babylonia areolata TaxID=304850 RepID=UPI003FCF89A2